MLTFTELALLADQGRTRDLEAALQQASVARAWVRVRLGRAQARRAAPGTC